MAMRSSCDGDPITLRMSPSWFMSAFAKKREIHDMSLMEKLGINALDAHHLKKKTLR
jgi:hypothetical protein